MNQKKKNNCDLNIFDRCICDLSVYVPVCVCFIRLKHILYEQSNVFLKKSK